MDNYEFVKMTKRYAVDGVVQEMAARLKSPRLMNEQSKPIGDLEKALAQWVADAGRAQQHRSEWFNRLSEPDQKMVMGLLEDAAANAIANFFALLDGVGGSFEGTFEIVAVDSENERIILNQENTEMLHDIFSDVCERDRRQES